MSTALQIREAIDRARAEGHQVGVEQGALRLQGALAAMETVTAALGTKIAASVEALTRALKDTEARCNALSRAVENLTARAEGAEAKIIELEAEGDPAADEAPG